MVQSTQDSPDIESGLDPYEESQYILRLIRDE